MPVQLRPVAKIIKQIRVWEKELAVRITGLGHFPAIPVKQIGEGVDGYYLHILSGSAEVGESGRTVNPLPLRWVGSNPTSPTKVKWLDMATSVQIRQHVLRRCDSLGRENSIVDSLYLPKQYWRTVQLGKSSGEGALYLRTTERNRSIRIV